MPYFETNDYTRLYFQDWGCGEPIVFISAWGLSSKMWQYQMVTLVDRGFRTIAFDRRGHGRSDHPGSGYDYDTLSDDLACLLDHLDLEAVTLISHSMGEGEIVRYLSRYGDDRVARIVLVSPLGPFPVAADGDLKGLDIGLVEAVRAGWKQDFVSWLEASQDAYVGKGLPGCDVPDGLVEWTKQDLLQTSLLAIIECNRAGMETDRRPDMRMIRVPALVIHGDQDASIDAQISGRVCAELIAGSAFKLYENAPHGLYLTHRDALTRDLAEFIERGSSLAPAEGTPSVDGRR